MANELVLRVVESSPNVFKKVYVDNPNKIYSNTAGEKKQQILNEYSITKQLNILRRAVVGDPDAIKELAEMTAYIDGIRAISNEAEKNATELTDDSLGSIA